MTIEDRVQAAFAFRASEISPPPDRWDEVARRAALARRRRQWRAAAASVVGLCAAATITIVAVGAIHETPSRRVKSSVPAATQPTTTVASTVAPLPSPTTSTPTPTLNGLALWPFASLQEALAWEQSYRSGGHQPWHLDAGLTAQSFTNGYLGYTGLDRVFTQKVVGGQAHVDVGFLNPNGAPVVAATIHLVRYGNDPEAPWEVVGTDDLQGFSVLTPSYGAAVTSPTAVGGTITGVDESIRIKILSLGAPGPIGQLCCLAAGGTNSPWRTSVSFGHPGAHVMTITASTGGHLAAVERFSVTAVMVSSG